MHDSAYSEVTFGASSGSSGRAGARISSGTGIKRRGSFEGITGFVASFRSSGVLSVRVTKYAMPRRWTRDHESSHGTHDHVTKEGVMHANAYTDEVSNVTASVSSGAF